MSGTRKDGLASKRIDQNTEQGKALQQVIQAKLKDYLGADYADDVLPLYIVVMLSHGNQAELMADNLEAFLGQAHAELFVKWLFQHLAEVGDKYAAPDQEGSRSSASTSVDGTSADEPGSEDGEASAMEQDNIQSSADQSQGALQHNGHATQEASEQDTGLHSQAVRQQGAEPSDRRRSRRSISPGHRLEEHNRGRHDHRAGPETLRQETYDRHRHSNDHPSTSRYEPAYRQQPDRRWADYRARGHHEFQQQGYNDRHHSPDRQYGRHSPPYGDRGFRDQPRGHMRSRREDDVWGYSSRTDREAKRRRSDPMADQFADGLQTAREDRGYRPRESRMRSDAILAQAAERRHQHQEPQAAPEPNALPRAPAVRSVIQRVSSADDEDQETDEQDRGVAARSRVRQPIRLFETAMREVAAPSQANRPSVFDRLTSQAANGNNAAAVTASALVKRLRKSAAAADSQGEDSSSTAALKQQLKRMEQEVTQLRKQQQTVLKKVASLPVAAAAVPAAAPVGAPVGALADAASVVVQNVHFSATPQILAAHFSGCGPATRVTILQDKLSGQPSGTAYVQFLTATQSAAALALTGSLLLQRPIAVVPKPSKPSYAFAPSMPYPGMHHASPRFAAQPYSPFGPHGSGFSEYTQGRGRGRGRGRGTRAASHLSRGGRKTARGGQGSEQGKSNVYIRPGLKQ